MKKFFIFCSVLVCISSFSQEELKNRIQKIVTVTSDTLIFHNTSVSPVYFELKNKQKERIDPITYKVDFAKAMILFNDATNLQQQLYIEYELLPIFLTTTYELLNEDIIVDTLDKSNIHRLNSKEKNTEPIPFEGLETKGSLSRGVTMGNNQDGVLSSNFNLQLMGKIASKINLKANITDNNIPLQENGYTQRLNEFDRVFIEMYSDKWRVTAGDIYFDDHTNNYMSFQKKVTGLSVDVDLDDENTKTNLFASGALVRGKYTRVNFNGIEANQGPYRLAKTDQQFLLIIANSETVYVNGIPLKRGINEDYMINYNTSELTFNTTYPINSNMRINVEFQESDENYTRFFSFNKASFKTKKLAVQVGFYNENDAKNQTLNQELNDDQITILATAGDDKSQMNALSAIAEEYITHKIQYRKEIQNGVEVFVFSTDSNEQHYSVNFNYVGNNNGDYKIDRTIATGKIYHYVAPLNNIKQGDYDPKTLLEAPEKLQISTAKVSYTPNDKTIFDTEFAYSTADKNLFSSIDDQDNTGFASKLNWKQLLIDKNWKLSSNLSYEMIQKNYNPIELIQNIEFKRDWNLIDPIGNQSNFQAGLVYENDSIGMVNYTIKNLDFGTFNGIENQINTNLTYKKTKILAHATLLTSNSDVEKTRYSTTNMELNRLFGKFKIGVKVYTENNLRTNNVTQLLSDLSHRNASYDTHIRFGEDVKINAEIGYTFRSNDSIQNIELQNISNSNTFYLKSKLLKNKTGDLDLYLNYRKLNNTYFSDDKSLNSKLQYHQSLIQDFINLNTLYETSSGSLPKQEYNYLPVNVGQGHYTWIDYNQNEIQELDEFEIAQFVDQATYVRILLPTTEFIRTNLTKFSQSVQLNPSQWASHKKIISHLSSQTSLQIENKQVKNATFQFNPFANEHLVSFSANFKNHFYFNRGKQHFSTTYSFLQSSNKIAYITGNQENSIKSNQLKFIHKLDKQWLIDVFVKQDNTISNHDVFINRNYNLLSNDALGKITYSHTNNTEFALHYNYKTKNNSLQQQESLLSNVFGVSYRYGNTDKLNLHTSFRFINNRFTGNEFSAVGFQMLEGLKNGMNFTWDLVLQKKLTKYLFVNLNYNARKSPDFKAIHTGNVQLRANF